MKTIFALAILMLTGVVISAARTTDKGHLQGRSTDALQRSIGRISFKKNEVIDALSRALQSAGLPGGIVKAEDNNSSNQDIVEAGPRLSDLLEKIVVVNTAYRWSVDDGVINLLPAGGDPSLLSLRIDQFDIVNAHSLNEAVNQLLARPEVQRRIVELKLNTGLSIIAGGSAVRSAKPAIKDPINLRLSNVTMRQALNSIVLAHGRAVWEYNETHWKDHHGFSIDFLVQ